MPAFTRELAEEYQGLFDTCTIPHDRQDRVRELAKKLVANQARYEAVAERIGCPWQFVAVIHNMESDGSFKHHLHNGDPLSARTVQVPAGRPAKGEPPFTWEQSADDALRMLGLHEWKDWSLPGLLYRLEAYNGFGTRKRGVRTPYLWSFSGHYTRGKFVADGVWNPDAVSKQCGAAVLLRELAAMGAFTPRPAPAPRPLPERFREVRYDPARVVPLAMELQRWLNDEAGAGLVADGRAGRNTSDAVRRLAGHLLPGDPRAG